MVAPALFEPKVPVTDFWHEAGIPSRGLPLIEAIEDGFKYATIGRLSKLTGFDKKELATFTNIPSATLARRAKNGRFNSNESDRLYRFAEVFNSALRLFENNLPSAHHWMNSPVKALGNQKPISMLRNSAQVDEVLNVIGRLEHGVFS